MKIEVVDVVLVKFPFSDLVGSKKRPALVLATTALSARDTLVTIAMVSSRVEAPRIEGDVLIEDWKDAALLHPSMVRLCKIATLDGSLIDKKVGRLSKSDRTNIAKQFRRYFDKWI